MNEALSRLSGLALSDRKILHERRSCTPVLFDSEHDDALCSQSKGSLTWETLCFISNMITQRIFDSILLQMNTIGGVSRSHGATLPKLTKAKSHATKQHKDKTAPNFLNEQENELLSSNRKGMEKYTNHISYQICQVADLQRQLIFTRTDLSLLWMREKNARLLEEILSDEATMRSLHRLQSAFENYELTLEPPVGFHCDQSDHVGKQCECYKNFDDYADFACVTECVDTILDSLSDNGENNLPGITAVSIFYLRLAPKLETEAVEDARQAFVEGKDFLLSIWERFVLKNVSKMAPADLFYMFFLLESLNMVEGHKGFQSCISIVKKNMVDRHVDIYSLEDPSTRIGEAWKTPQKPRDEVNPQPELSTEG
ncbi:hypothetical protein XU18_0259 [Perkinsela sp. CCAP 1560/4]|nr:hypothetical protein XU18_0259 [Perkinsela sp. CCAP 1560/4]|eukprot:KNH09574.1 hypothetical protein XU18_0259 [Perkinsela sp. CCAP 1560/4]